MLRPCARSLQNARLSGGLPQSSAGVGLSRASSVTAPMYPVPMTMQTFAILLVAGLAGARLGIAIVMTWLAQAALGLPFLAEGSGGLDPFAGPTAGISPGSS